MFKKLKLILLISIFVSGCAGLRSKSMPAVGQQTTSTDVLFVTEPETKSDPYYDNILKILANKSKQNLEEAKIEYLIERIRLSPFSFVRNNQAYQSNIAAQFLDWKYHRKKEQAQTAKAFIENLASKSSSSGRDYLTVRTDGKTFRLRDVLINELVLLESKLSRNSPGKSLS